MHNAGRNVAIIALFLAILGVAAPGQNVENSQDKSSDLASCNSQRIPLSEVWSNRIPGTRDVFEFEPNAPLELMKFPREHRDYRSTGNTLTFQIATKLDPLRSKEPSSQNKPSRPKMFAVLGHGEEALRAAYSVLVDGKEPQRAFSRGDDITLVFFARRHPAPIHIRRITRKANTITIEYQFALPESFPHNTMCLVHLALIPVGSVQPKQICVEVNRVPTENVEMEQRLTRKRSHPVDSIDYVVSGACRIDIR